MTSTNLSPKQLNFAQISIVCVDILKQCLIDILDIHIKPTDLSKEIHLSQSLKDGKDKLNSEQRDLCCFSSLGVPDYSKFDVTLLYRLIRNLCPTLKPSKDWGKEPKTTDLTIGDDIERIRLFRNKHYAHADSAEITDTDFTDLWKEGKSLIHRIQIFTTANGCTTDYGLKLTNISGRMIKYEEYTSYVNLFRAISIERNVEVTCGDTAQFKADIRLEESAFLSVSWEKVDGSSRKHIDISCEKYKGSTGRQLNIHSVCKEDGGEYQAVISRNLDHKILSNIGFLQTQGELPLLHNLTVSTTKEEICIHYSHTVPENSPRSNDIRWTKNKTPLDLTNNKYCGGGLDDSFLRFTCPSKEDSGEYSCTVTNAVGWVSRLVILDKPSAKISTNTPVVHGSETRFSCLISSCPSPEETEWQKSCDGNIFHRIDINELKYYGSNEDPSSPVLCLPKTTFDDQQFYRIAVRNKIGECTSDTHFLEVVGNRPNITNAICTTNDRSVRLNCDVFLYDKSPALQDVYWTKNDRKLDIQGSGGKYLGVSPDDPSLTINNVNKHDAGNYQLTAINSVGPTKSDDIVLGTPDIVLTRINRNKDGSQCFTMTISSLPSPFFVQWSMEDKKSGTSGTLQQINVNAEEYKGTSNSFPRPVLVVKHNESFKNYSFRIQVENVIGFTEKIMPDETNPMFFKSDENTVNVGNLNRNFKGGGRNIRFGKLFDELAEKFPDAKISRLKDLIQNSYKLEDVKSLEQAKSARDCFRILRSENIISPENVMLLQHLLKTTECEELETKCIEYAKMHDAMYYYENPPDNGYKNVHFHVVANIGCYSTEQFTEIRGTVAAIVGCTIEEVLVNGYLHSASFILVLSIKNDFVNKLLALKRKDKDKLSKISIDYFKIGSTVICLKFLRDASFLQMDMDKEKLEVNYGIQVSERSPRHTWDIVAAFDIGTSYSGYAYSDRKEMDLKSISFNQWTGNMVSNPKAKAPTTVLFDKNMRFHSFGYEAENFYATQVCKKKNDKWYRFKNFKMVLYREKNVHRDLKISDDLERVSLLASEVFSQTIKSLKSHFESTVKERALQFEPGNVLYVVTVPAIWKQSAKLFMKEAAMQAGIPEAQLLIALEPEAAAMYCKSLPEQTLTDTFKPHKRYMVLDLGGGTVDVVVHDVLEDGGLAEVYKASGGDWGGTMVDLEFERYIQNIFNSETCLKELWNLSPRDAYDLEREFEMQKRQISNKAADLRMKLPARLQQVGKVPVTSSITFGHIYVQYPKFKEFFENPKNRIISLIKDILNEVERLDKIILVGGFSSSPYLYDQIKSHSDISSIDICCPKEPGLAVLQGAVLFGYNPEDVRYRICRYTFGFGVLQDFDESKHRADKRDVVDGEDVCKDVFDVLVYEGEKVKFDDPKVATSKSSHREAYRKHLSIKKQLFAGKNIPRDRIVYVTDEGIEFLGDITSHAPKEGWSNLVEFKTKIYFGQTEIKIEDVDTVNSLFYAST